VALSVCLFYISVVWLVLVVVDGLGWGCGLCVWVARLLFRKFRLLVVCAVLTWVVFRFSVSGCGCGVVLGCGWLVCCGSDGCGAGGVIRWRAVCTRCLTWRLLCFQGYKFRLFGTRLLKI
jgi:hypothetical protein